WTDANRDDIAQDSEIGPVQTPFNTTTNLVRNPDPNIKRPYQYEYTAGIQREVVPGVSVSFNWVRRDYKRTFWTDNILVSDSDYTVVNVPHPLDSVEMITLFYLNVAKRGQVQQIDKNSDVDGKWYNGYDIG